MRACWLKWVGRDWSISADYIWLNYSDANSGLSLATGFILDSVAKVEKKQWEVNVYSKYAYDDQPGHPTSMPSER